MALISADPDRFLPLVYGGATTTKATVGLPDVGLPDDYSDIITGEGVLDSGDATLVYENVSEERVAEVMSAIAASGAITMTGAEVDAARARFSEDGWR